MGNYSAFVTVAGQLGRSTHIVRKDVDIKRQLTSRLVTRTKESNMHVSIMVENHRVCVMKVKVVIGTAEERSGRFSERTVHLRPIQIFLKDLSKNMYVGTRKMVNYECLE